MCEKSILQLSIELNQHINEYVKHLEKMVGKKAVDSMRAHIRDQMHHHRTAEEEAKEAAHYAQKYGDIREVQTETGGLLD